KLRHDSQGVVDSTLERLKKTFNGIFEQLTTLDVLLARLYLEDTNTSSIQTKLNEILRKQYREARLDPGHHKCINIGRKSVNIYLDLLLGNKRSKKIIEH
ncbi:MAG: hypothetical protein Q9M76_03295, partial [Candidatus Dojkabacteria bacterium]|nr:hypothetical protein [Candidatus Dojkabacteria bacterium]